VGLFSLYAVGNLSKDNLPDNSFVVNLSTTMKYHGCLTFHPASSPCININHACKTLIKLCLKGKGKDLLVNEVITQRNKSKITYISFQQMLEKYHVTIKTVAEEYLVY